jgi:hypothetical protein
MLLYSVCYPLCHLELLTTCSSTRIILLCILLCKYSDFIKLFYIYGHGFNEKDAYSKRQNDKVFRQCKEIQPCCELILGSVLNFLCHR